MKCFWSNSVYIPSAIWEIFTYSVSYLCSAIWEFVCNSGPDKNAISRGSFWLSWKLTISWYLSWWWWWWWWWWCWIVFVEWFTHEKQLALFPAGTIVRYLHHRKSLHAASRIWTCAERGFRLSRMKLCSSDNHYTMWSFSRFLIADMSVKIIVGLDFMVEVFTWKTVIKASCACYILDACSCLHCQSYLELQ